VRCFQNKCTVNLRSLPLNVNVLKQERVNQRVALCQSLMASKIRKVTNQNMRINSSLSKSSTFSTRLRITDSYLSSPSVTELAPLTLTTGDDFTVTLSVTPTMNSLESQVICPRAYDCKERIPPNQHIVSLELTYHPASIEPTATGSPETRDPDPSAYA